MKIKNLYISAGVLALLSIFTYSLKNKGSGPSDDPRIGNPIIEDATLREVASITLDSKGKAIHIKRDDASSKWLLKERVDMPVDMSTLTRFIQSISESNVLRLVTSKEERLPALGFTDKQVIQLNDDQGNSLLSVQLGKSADNNRQIVRLNNENKAYLISNTININTAADSWLNKELLKFEQADARSIEIGFHDGKSYAFSRDTADADWTCPELPTGKVPNKSKIDQVLKLFSNLRFSSTQDIDHADVTDARNNSRKISITLASGQSFTASLGRRPEQVIEPEPSEATEEESTEGTTEPETTPAGPVFALVTDSDSTNALNTYMQKIAFELSTYTFTSLPQSPEDLSQDAPKEEKTEDSP